MTNNKAKSIRQPAKSPFQSGNTLIEFKITVPNAQKVALAGTFNGWDPNRTPLRNEGDGVWRVFLPLTKGQYEYRYVVDGQWQTDSSATQVSPNPFGGHNSVLTIAEEPRAKAA